MAARLGRSYCLLPVLGEISPVRDPHLPLTTQVFCLVRVSALQGQEPFRALSLLLVAWGWDPCDQDR